MSKKEGWPRKAYADRHGERLWSWHSRDRQEERHAGLCSEMLSQEIKPGKVRCGRVEITLRMQEKLNTHSSKLRHMSKHTVIWGNPDTAVEEIPHPFSTKGFD